MKFVGVSSTRFYQGHYRKHVDRIHTNSTVHCHDVTSRLETYGRVSTIAAGRMFLWVDTGSE